MPERHRTSDIIVRKLSERNNSKRKIVGRPRKDLVAKVSAFGFPQRKQKYVLLGLRSAKRLFGEGLKSSMFVDDIVRHLAEEYDIIMEHKMPEVVVRKGYSPFYVLKLQKELEALLPKKYSQMRETIIQSILAGRYKDVDSSITRLQDIDDELYFLPEEFKSMENSIRVLLFVKRYSNMDSCVKVLRGIVAKMDALKITDPGVRRATLSRVFHKGGSVFERAVWPTQRKK